MERNAPTPGQEGQTKGGAAEYGALRPGTGRAPGARSVPDRSGPEGELHVRAVREPRQSMERCDRGPVARPGRGRSPTAAAPRGNCTFELFGSRGRVWSAATGDRSRARGAVGPRPQRP